MLIKNVHPHVLKKFKSKTEGEVPNTPKRKDKALPEEQEEDGEGENNKDDYDEEDDENNWLCDGSDCFMEGCKSGMTEFGLHTGVEAWTSTGEDCDFDLCEMCIRWCIHCENQGISPGLKPYDDE